MKLIKLGQNGGGGKLSVLLFLAVAGGSPLCADTAYWTNNVSSVAYWTNTLFWVDGNGDNLVEPPTNHTHDVVFSPLETDGVQTLYWNHPTGTKGGQQLDFGMLSILDSSWACRRRIRIRNGTTASDLQEWGVNITIDDPDGFGGLWYSDYGKVGFTLPATAERSPHLSNVSIDKRVPFTVSSEGTKAYVETLYARGAIEKKGAGELHVMATSGSDTIAHVSGGTLTLEGSPEPDPGDDLPVPGAVLHLDASRTDTMMTYTGEDGRTYVTNWADVRGNGRSAWFNRAWRHQASHQTEFSNPPFLNDTFVPGTTVVDFGRSSTNMNVSLGPLGCWLVMSQDPNVSPWKDVREVFYAGMYHSLYSAVTIPGNQSDGTKYYPFHRSSTGFTMVPEPGKSTYVGCLPVAFGDLLFDGVSGGNAGAGGGSGVFDALGFSVVGVGTTNAVNVSAIATDRMYAGRVGGCRVGEFILYTNSLTHAERYKISRYLMRKWKNAGAMHEDVDADVVTLKSNNVSLGVPEGRLVKVQEVMAGGGTLVKTGGGTLAVGALTTVKNAKAPSVDVQGGEVEFDVVDASADAPAADPYLWLDATAESSFVFTNGTDEAKEYLAQWNDRRPGQTAVYAKIPPNTNADYVEGSWPYLARNAVGDKTVVDFGPYATKANGAAFMVLNTGTGTANAYEAYVVFRLKTTSGANIFGANDILLYRASSTRLLHGTYGRYPTHAAAWTVDGAAADPLCEGQGSFDTTSFHVVGMSADSKLNLTLVGGKDRIGQGTGFGGQQVAEQILYDRKLSPAERRQTVAYLMKRWLGKDAPGIGPTRVASMKFANDAPVVLNTAGELDVESVSGGNGTVVKRGDGSVTLSPMDDTDGTSALSVEGGVLNVELTPAFIDAAAFHIDASDVDSLTYYVTDDGARTNVTKVVDVRRNGIEANAWINYPAKDAGGVERSIAQTNPVWRAIERADGVARPAFDFGRKSSYYGQHLSSSSGFRLNKRFSNILDAHAVFSDTTSNDRQTFFCDYNDKYHYMRDGVKLFNKTYASSSVTNGYIAIDGEEVGPYSAYPSGFHVISCAPTSTTYVSALALERNIDGGGCYISEMICFSNRLTSARRRFLQDLLMHKWMGEDKPVWPNAYSSIHVAAGAMLNLQCDAQLSVGRVSGGGTVSGVSLCNVAELEIACAGGTTAPITFSGDIAFAPTVTVMLAGETGTLESGGTYALASAPSVAAEGTRWTVEGLPARQHYRVSAADGTLSLSLVPAGTVFLFR